MPVGGLVSTAWDEPMRETILLGEFSLSSVGKMDRFVEAGRIIEGLETRSGETTLSDCYKFAKASLILSSMSIVFTMFL